MLDLTEAIVIQDTFRDVTGTPGGAGVTFLGAVVRTGEPRPGRIVSARITTSTALRWAAWPRWKDEGGLSLGVLAKVALGASQQLVIIDGVSTAMVIR